MPQPSEAKAARGHLALWRWLACGAGGALVAVAAGWPSQGGLGEAAIAHALVSQWGWALQGLGLTLWMLAITARPRPSPVRAAALTAAFAVVWQGVGLSWLYVGLNEYLLLAVPGSVAAVLALALYLASYTVAAVAWWAWAERRRWQRPARSGVWVPALALAAAWLLGDLGRAMVMTGFPWAAGGYPHLHGPFRVLVPWVGVYGVGAVAALAAALLVRGVLCGPPQGFGRRAGAAGPGPLARVLTGSGLVVVLGGLASLPDGLFTRPAGEFDALLLQANVDQHDKFGDSAAAQAAAGQALGWHLGQLARAEADLTLTAETAIPTLESDLPAVVGATLAQRVQARPGVLLVGVPQGRAGGGQFNAFFGRGSGESLAQAGTDGLYRYQKAHLVPFGEFSPPGFAWFTRQLDLPLPDFQSPRGEPRPLLLRTRGGSLQRLAPLICFEDLYGEELARRFASADGAPTALVNGSNLAWFDDSPAMAQHLRIAQFRSLEFQRATLRAANTGPTVLIDHHGRVVRSLPPRTRDRLAVVAEGRDGLTPYAWWVGRFGLWPLVGLAVAGLVVHHWGGKRR